MLLSDRPIVESSPSWIETGRSNARCTHSENGMMFSATFAVLFHEHSVALHRRIVDEVGRRVERRVASLTPCWGAAAQWYPPAFEAKPRELCGGGGGGSGINGGNSGGGGRSLGGGSLGGGRIGGVGRRLMLERRRLHGWC